MLTRHEADGRVSPAPEGSGAILGNLKSQNLFRQTPARRLCNRCVAKEVIFIGIGEQKMNRSLLDNCIWHALSSHQQHLAIKGKKAARYQPEVSVWAATQGNKQEEFVELRKLVSVDEVIAVAGKIPEKLDGWEVMFSDTLLQMICEEIKPRKRMNYPAASGRGIAPLKQLELLHM